mmetsp:Transcript_8069/g.26444  ORF Transcript_8069/g.26444 Transcript_8069/m.26444 type:complete len:237 (+) Transcript_8069:6353-7063(+)
MHFGPAHASRRLHVRLLARRQLARQGGAVHRHRPAGGQPSTRHAAAPAAGARLPRRPGAARMAAHAAKRAAAAVAARRGAAREHHGRPRFLGRREDVRRHVRLHARVVLPDSVQAHALWLRVGPRKPRRRRQPARVRAHALRKGPDAPLGPLPRLLHGARHGRLELQLPGRAALEGDEVRAQACESRAVLRREAPALPLLELYANGAARPRRGRRREPLRVRHRRGQKATTPAAAK